MDSIRFYDLVFVGSGASATYTLINVIDNILASGKQTSIAIVEKGRYFHSGVAYGNRSGQKSLILTKLGEFLPEGELDKFVSWMKVHHETEYQELCGVATSDSSDDSEIRAENSIIECSVRRALVGSYLQFRAECAIRKAGESGHISVSLLSETVTSIDKHESGGYCIKCKSSATDLNEINCRHLALCLGSAATMTLNKDKHFVPSVKVIDNLYESCIDQVLNKALTSIAVKEEESRRRLAVIVGTNASALDAIYVLKSLLVNFDYALDILAISGSGEFPEPVMSQAKAEEFPSLAADISLAFTNRLDSRDKLLATTLYEVADSVFAQYHNSEVPLIIYRDLVDQEVIRYIDKLDENEMSDFLINYANKLGKHKRRVEQTYYECAVNDSDKSKLTVKSGRVILVNNKDDLITVGYSEGNQCHEVECDIVINCMGGEFVDMSSSDTLLKNLLQSGIVSYKEGGTGLVVDDSFEVAPNMYAMGPMLAGNKIKGSYIWHLEHLGRIIRFSKILGSSIGEKL